MSSPRSARAWLRARGRLLRWFGDELAVLPADVADYLRITDRAVEARNAVATVVPIKGDLTGPDVQLWPTIMGVLRNAFVEGLTTGYAHLPPPTSEAPPPKPPEPEPNAPVPTP